MKGRKCIIRFSQCVLMVVIFLESVCVGLERVRWEELPAHLEANSRDLLDVNTCDCPEDVRSLEPVREIAQYIENTFYLWKEYEVANGEDGNFLCIVMEKPQVKPLSAGEACILLTGSSLWKWTRPTIEEQPTGKFSVQAIIGDDDRTWVEDTNEAKWNTHCFLYCTMLRKETGDTWSICSPNKGTGCLVGPYTLLTCAHVLMVDSTGRYRPYTIQVVPGRNRGDARPLGQRETMAFDIDPRYGAATNPIEEMYDIGVVHFDDPLFDVKTYMPITLRANLSYGDDVELAGYPLEVDSVTVPEMDELWEGRGTIGGVGETMVLYTVDSSGGQSGGPVRWGYPRGEREYVVGVNRGGVSSGNAEARNSCVRFGSHNRDLVPFPVTEFRI